MNGIKYRSADEMKDSGIEWIRQIPREWGKSRIKYSSSLISKGTTPSTIGREIVEEGIIRFIKGENIVDNSLVLDPSYYIDKKTHDLLSRSKLRIRDVLVVIAGSIGKIAIIDNETLPANTSQAIAFIRPKSDSHPGFLRFWLMSEYAQALIKFTAVQSAQPNLSMEDLGNIHMTWPSPFEQRKIANFLNIKTAQFDSIIAKKEQLIAKLEEAKKSLISEVVTGKVKIVDGQLVPRQPEEMKDSGVEWLGMIPKEWKIKRTKYIFVESGSKSRQGKEVPLSMSQKFGLIKSEDMESIPNQAISNVGNKICKVGDLVFNKLKSHLGVFAVSQFYGIVSPDYAVYSPLDCVNSKYYEYLFKTPTYITQFNKRSKGVGAGLTRLYTDDLFDIFCLAPTNSQQNEIVKYLETLIEKTRQVQAKTSFQIELLKSAKQSLISEAVTGKIDLRDWEIIEQGGAS